jgi:hypothetical protein
LDKQVRFSLSQIPDFLKKSGIFALYSIPKIQEIEWNFHPPLSVKADIPRSDAIDEMNILPRFEGKAIHDG